MCHVDVIPIPQLPIKKLKQFEDIMQKDTSKNISPWFFQFQGVLGLQPPKQKLFWSEGIAHGYLPQKLAKINPHSIFMPIAKGVLCFKYK